MADNLRFLKMRLKNIENIGQVTKAMKLVATAKYSRSIKQRSLQLSLKQALDELHISIPSQTQPRIRLVWVIGTQRGFCGSYNQQLGIYFWQFFKHQKDDVPTFYVIQGKRLTQVLKRFITQEHTHIRFHPTSMELVLSLKPDHKTFLTIDTETKLTAGFLDRWYNLLTRGTPKPIEIQVIYQKFYSALEYRPHIETMILGHTTPILPDDLSEGQKRVYPALIRTYEEINFKIQIARYLSEAQLSEHAARRQAMDSAEKNAKEMRKQVKQTYQRVRQALITKEIIEIVSGVEVLKGNQSF